MNECIYYNGTILTMEEEEQYPEAILVSGQTICKEGSLKEVKACAGEGVTMRDLEGHTLMPAFIDSHSHFSAYATSLMEVNLENAMDFQEIIGSIQDFIKKNEVPKGEWVVAGKYDHNYLKEHSHPTRALLDQAFPDNPVVLKHASGHMGVFNSLGLKTLGITEDTKPVPGGIIEQKDGKLTGFLAENSYIEYVKKTPMPSMEQIAACYRKGQQVYESYGITTAQEGYMVKELIPLIQLLQYQKLLEIDLIGYMDFDAEEEYKKAFPNAVLSYDGHFKIGGLKTFLDGSPQGRTAWMLTPYQGEEKEYYSEPVQTEDAIRQKVRHAVEENYQLLCHCNGDAAIAAYIEAYRKEKKADTKIRPVIIHAQLMNEDEVKAAKELGMMASFFVAHVYYWGDIHCKNFGYERASSISPAKTAEKEGLIYTLHQDSPVIEPNMLETVWCAVNRKTKEGKELGLKEAVTPYEALKAVTIHAAYQYFEEDRKGSIKENKLADLVILEENPLKADPARIKDIAVLETIKAGKTVYRLESTRK